MKVGDIVRLKEEHHLSTFLVGYCIIFGKIQGKVHSNGIVLRSRKKNRYHIKTLNKNSDGDHSMTWIYEDEVISISEIRNLKLNELGI
jgi:hypothetical protein